MANSHSTDGRRIPAVGYVRMSSDRQEASPAQQRAEIEKLAERDNYEIIRWYVDEGIAGWKEDRADFQRLIADTTTKADFRAVLCWDQNRFSRFPVLEANHYWYLLDKAGVHLATVNQGRLDWHSIAGWLTASIKQHSDAQHRFELSANVKRGKRAVAERGEWQGKIPFAYVVVDRRLQLGDPLEVEIIRRIYREYIKGHSLRSIAHGLNSEGVKSPTGNGWAPEAIRDKLTNPAYAGNFRWNDIEIRDNHPAIIDLATSETVQRLLAERQRKTTPKRDGGDFLFTGIVRCGKCDSSMVGFANESRLYYLCRGHKSKGKSFCDLNSVRQDELFGRVIDAIEGHFMNPTVVKRLREELHRQIKREFKKVDPGAIRSQLSRVEAKLSKAKRRLVEVDPDMLTVVQEQIRELRDEHDRLQSALENAQTPRNLMFEEADAKIDRAVNLFSNLRERLHKADPTHQRNFLRETVKRIEVWAERSGRRNNFRLDHGIIHLRSDNLSGSSD